MGTLAPMFLLWYILFMQDENDVKFNNDVGGDNGDTSGDNDVVIEPDVEMEAEGNIMVKMKELRDKLKKCDQEKGEYLAGWQRAKADFINARREEDERRGEFAKYCEQGLIKEFLGMADSFDALFGSAEIWQNADANFKQGIQNIYVQLMTILNGHNVKTVETKGKKFNPAEHEAIGEEKVDAPEKDGVIIAELRKGYTLNGRVLRPAQVRVGKFG